MKTNTVRLMAFFMLCCLLFALPAGEAEACLAQLRQAIPAAAIVGYVTEKEAQSIILE